MLILSGTNAYSGGTIVDAGTLVLTSGSALPDGSSLTVGERNDDLRLLSGRRLDAFVTGFTDQSRTGTQQPDASGRCDCRLPAELPTKGKKHE